MRILLRYCLFQIPGIMLGGIAIFLLWHWKVLNTAWALTLFGLWVLKDVLLYPYSKPALEDPPPTGSQALISCKGLVRTDVRWRGLVEVQGERWQARSQDGSLIRAGTRVQVVDAQGLLLVVVPVDRDH